MDAPPVFLLDNLKRWILHYEDIFRRVQHEFDHLQVEVGLLKEFMKNVTFKALEGDETFFKEQEREIRETIYDAEETIERYIIQISDENSRMWHWRSLSRREMVISCREHRVRPLISRLCETKTLVNSTNIEFSEDTTRAAAVTTNTFKEIMDRIDSGAQKELEHVYTEFQLELGMLRDFLAGGTYKEWEGQITEAVYEAEDIVDTFKTHNFSGEAKTCQCFRQQQGVTGQDLVQLMLSFEKERLKPLLALLPEGKIPANSTKVDISDEHYMRAAFRRDIQLKKMLPKNIVGFKNQADELIQYLNQETDKLETISITGKPGAGKTTLAWKISCDPRITEKFPTLIWVNVSSELDMKHVLLAILSRVTTYQQRELIEMGIGNLTVIVRDYLLALKFLLVLDDVPTAEAWREITAFLPTSNKFGRVILTTSQRNVASIVNVRRQAHELRLLSPEESWELLQYEAHGEVGDVSEELVTVGKAVAELCNRNPLAMKVIGGILKCKVSKGSGPASSIKQEWEDLKSRLQTSLLNDEFTNRLDKIISLSYLELPIELRKCFLYMGMFPQGFEIPVKNLYLLWISEGFVERIYGARSERTAQNILMDLINRNLVMVEKVKPNGDVKSCRLHETIHEFCKMTVTFENLNFFQEITKTRGVFEPSPEIMRRYHHLCIHSNISEFFKGKAKLLKARSFLCFPKTPINLKSEDISHVIDGMSLLRVLAAENIFFQKFPRELVQLIHLKFLILAYKSETLPKVITKLRNLQTLIVDNSLPILVIRADIWKMMNLRHLMTKASIVLKSGGEGNGSESLQTLGRLSPRSCTAGFANKATHLIELVIQGKLLSLWDSSCLEKLDGLKKLKLVHDGPPLQLPKEIRFPPNIRVLVLKGTFLPWEQTSTLATLVSLEELTLKDNAFSGISWEATREVFNKLEILCIEQADVESWTASDNSFPKLRTLSLISCENLKEIPFNLKMNLQALYMERVTRSAVLSAEKIGRAKDKEVAHGKAFKLEIAPADKMKSLARDKQCSDGIESGEPSSSTSS